MRMAGAGIEPATFRFQLEVIPGQAYSYWSGLAQAEPASVVGQWMSLMAARAGLATQPCHGQPTPNVAANRVLTNVLWDGSPPHITAGGGGGFESKSA